MSMEETCLESFFVDICRGTLKGEELLHRNVEMESRITDEADHRHIA